MKCAVHSDVDATGYCRNCGKHPSNVLGLGGASLAGLERRVRSIQMAIKKRRQDAAAAKLLAGFHETLV
jgi:hypothetical protein